jgi:hypothetical protein
MIYHVSTLRKTCNACPAQWEGKTDAHEDVYIRYRWGNLRVEINGRVVHAEFLGEDTDDEAYFADMRKSGWPEDVIEKMISSHKVMREFNEGAPICYDGYMDLEELRVATKDILELPEHEDLSAE